MGNLASDHDAAIELIVEEYPRLQSLDPSHQLLQYILDVTKDGFRYSPIDRVRQEFVHKYGPDDMTPAAVMLARYYLDLRKAVDEIKGIDRSPKPNPPAKATPVETLDEIDWVNNPPF